MLQGSLTVHFLNVINATYYVNYTETLPIITMSDGNEGDYDLPAYIMDARPRGMCISHV